MDKLDSYAIGVVGVLLGGLLLWTVLEPVIGFIGLLFGSDKKKND